MMLFPDFPIGNTDLRSFPDHYEILTYLKNYCEHFQLGGFIQFGKLVEQVLPVPLPDTPASSNSALLDCVKWRVTTKSIESGERNCDEFDFVFVCSG